MGVVVADPGPLGLFLNPIYDRGAATLHALRVEIGDAAFFELAQTWVERFGGGTASTADFIALAEEVSGQELDGVLRGLALHRREAGRLVADPVIRRAARARNGASPVEVPDHDLAT